MKHIYKNLNFYGIMELICQFIRLILQSIKLIYQSTLFFPGLRLPVLGPGGHNGVELRVLGETVNKGDRHVPEEQEPLPGIAVRHIGKLVGAYPQLLRQDLPVPLRLGEKHHEIAVLEDVLDLPGGKEVVG